MESAVKAASITPSIDAEEFMALLLSAQSAKHNCPYCAYFKKGARGLF